MAQASMDDVDLVIKTMAKTIVDNADYFAQLDSVVGDGDFGYSLARGFEVVLSDWDAMEYTDVAGLLKKTANAGALESLTVETAVLFLPALGYLVVLATRGTAAFGAGHPGRDVLLAGAGVVTAVPLLFFGAAATRIPLTTIGLLQYVTPIMQLALGVLVRHEPMPPARLAGFVLVWVALAVLTADGLRNHRRQQQLAAELV